MITANIHEAKTNLSKLLENVSQGENIIITKFNKPIAKISPYMSEKKERPFGLLKGQISMPDDFDECCPEIEDLFYNSPIYNKE